MHKVLHIAHRIALIILDCNEHQFQIDNLWIHCLIVQFHFTKKDKQRRSSRQTEMETESERAEKFQELRRKNDVNNISLFYKTEKYHLGNLKLRLVCLSLVIFYWLDVNANRKHLFCFIYLFIFSFLSLCLIFFH